jgi:hypothetical protein
VRRGVFHFLFVGFYIFFLGVLLPGHDHHWVRIGDYGDGDPDEAFSCMSTPPPGHQDLPHDDDCGHCAFCQFQARISHSPVMPVIVPTLLPLNFVFIARAPAYVPADIDPTYVARGPPMA